MKLFGVTALFLSFAVSASACPQLSGKYGTPENFAEIRQIGCAKLTVTNTLIENGVVKKFPPEEILLDNVRRELHLDGDFQPMFSYSARFTNEGLEMIQYIDMSKVAPEGKMFKTKILVNLDSNRNLVEQEWTCRNPGETPELWDGFKQRVTPRIGN